MLLQRLALVLVSFISLSAWAEVNRDYLISQGINPNAVDASLTYYFHNLNQFSNRRIMTIVDFTKASSQKRMFVVDMESGSIERYFVAHGSHSGRGKWVTRVSNQIRNPVSQVGSFESAVGPFLVTSESWSGHTGHHLLMNGLEDTPLYGNGMTHSRQIYVHGTKGIDPRSQIARSLGYGKLSEGCFMVEKQWIEHVVKKLRGGSLLFAYWSYEEVARNMARGDDKPSPADLNDGYIDDEKPKRRPQRSYSWDSDSSPIAEFN